MEKKDSFDVLKFFQICFMKGGSDFLRLGLKIAFSKNYNLIEINYNLKKIAI